MGDEIDAPWYGLRSGEGAIQAGFCPDVAGERVRGSFPMAAAIADVKPQPWLGVFRLADDLWWYIAVRDGNAILPDGDVVGTEAEILAARERHSGFDDWQYLEGGPDELSSLLDQARKLRRTGQLRRTDSQSLTPYLISIAAIVVAGAAWWVHRAVTETHMPVAFAQRMAPHPAAPPAWLATPPPSALLDACVHSVDTIPLSVDGWRLTQVHCALHARTASASATWVRTNGASVASRPKGILALDGNHVSEPMPLTLPNGAGSQTVLVQSRAVNRFWTVIQEFDLRARLSAATAVAPLPGTTRALAPAAQGLRVSITFDGRPAHIGGALDSVRGLRITNVHYHADNQWSASGTLHVRAPTLAAQNAKAAVAPLAGVRPSLITAAGIRE